MPVRCGPEERKEQDMTHVLCLGDKHGGGIDRAARDRKAGSFWERTRLVQNSIPITGQVIVPESVSPEPQDFLKPNPVSWGELVTSTGPPDVRISLSGQGGKFVLPVWVTAAPWGCPKGRGWRIEPRWGGAMDGAEGSPLKLMRNGVFDGICGWQPSSWKLPEVIIGST